jgi:cysteine desulfurase
VIFHTDAADSVGVVPIDVQALGVDLLSFAANTFYGPTGVGGLYVRRGTRVFPLLDGGIQENNKRAGAENLIGIIGMGKAAELGRQEMESRLKHVKGLKETLLAEFPNYVDEYILNTHPEYSLPNMVSVSIKYIEGESVMLMLDDDDIAISTRSACATGSLRASHVLLSLGLSHADAQGTLVLSVGIDNTEDDIFSFLNSLKTVVTTLRDISPLYSKKNASSR